MVNVLLLLIVVCFFIGIVLGMTLIASELYKPIITIKRRNAIDTNTFEILCQKKDKSRMWIHIDLNKESEEK